MASRTISPPCYPPVTPPSAARAQERLCAGDVRHGIVHIIGAWGFGAVFFNLVSGAVWVAFARSIGANDQVIGLMAAALPLTGLLQLIAARVVDTRQRPKPQMIGAGVLGRALWLVVALAPLVSRWRPDMLPQRAVVPLVVACVLGVGAGQAFNTPAFYAWMGGLIPSRIRPSFYARRIQVGTLAGLGATLFSGWIADKSPHLTTYCLILGIAAICGIIDVSLFYRVREAMRPPVEESAEYAATKAGVSEAAGACLPERTAHPSGSALFAPLADPGVRTFLGFVALMSTSLGLLGPFVWLHTMEHLGWSKTLAGMLLSVVPMLAVVLTSRFWGGVIQRHGTRPVNRFVSASLTLMPLAWLVEGPSAPWVLGGMSFLSGVLGAGYDQCTANVITGMKGRASAATMTALCSIAAGGGFTLASCGGGALAQWLHGMNYEVYGTTLNQYHVLFGIALMVRLYMAAFVAPKLVEPTSTPTRDAVRDVLRRR